MAAPRIYGAKGGIGLVNYCFDPLRKTLIPQQEMNRMTDGLQSVQDSNAARPVPLWEKENLTIEEAAAYFGVGQNRIRALTDSRNCDFVLFVGNRRLIKRKKFAKYLENAYSI